MNLVELWAAVAEAFRLLAAFPFTWLAAVVVFLLVVESLMFIPVVGFVVKLMLASFVVVQFIAMFAVADAGTAPSLLTLLSAFSQTPATQLVLYFSALFPFAVGVLYLYAKAGRPAIAFFFSNILKTKPPEKQLFLQFKLIMLVLALPFTLLAGAIVLKGLTGLAALSAAVAAALSNWLALALLLVLSIDLEIASVQLPVLLPKALGATLALVLLLAFVAWTFAFTYTVSKQAFPNAPPRIQSSS